MSIFFAVIAIFTVTLGFAVLFGAPYVPSKSKEVYRAFRRLYRLGSDDLLVDLGSGDGVVLRRASQCGARAVGYEINPILVRVSRFLSRGDSNVTVHQANIWKAQFPVETTVVYIFGESRDIAKMMRLVQGEATRLKHGLTVISYGFKLPDAKLIKKEGAHFMYVISPLQPE